VQGLAASHPFDRRDPLSPANRRISIVVMTREAEERVFRGSEATPPLAAASPATPGSSPGEGTR